MRGARGYGLVLALSLGLSLGALPLSADDAAAQGATTILTTGGDCSVVESTFIPVGVGPGSGSLFCPKSTSTSGPGGDATAGRGGSGGSGGRGGHGGPGGDGGFASVHDIANAHANASSSVTVGDITTGDASGHNIAVDATGADDPVVLAIAGSFSDTGVDIFAPGGNAQAGTTGGYGIAADASGGAGGAGGDGGEGGDGGDGGDATGGDSGDSASCAAGLLGCLGGNLSLLLAP
jgi:hypothetical protein